MNSLENRLNAIEDRHGYFSKLVEERFTNVKLLQIELLNIIANIWGTDYLSERFYHPPSRERVDIWFKHNNMEYWMELRMIATNYHRTGGRAARAITHSTSMIIEDYERLYRIRTFHVEKYLLFSYLPVYRDSYPYLETQFDRIFYETNQRMRIVSPIFHIGLRDIQDADLAIYLSKV